MKTKEFIERLEEEAGHECFIRWDGVPVSVEISTKGPFSYLDDDGKMHFTMEGYRVLINSKSMTDFIHQDLAQWYDGQKKSASIADDRKKLLKKLMALIVFETDESRSKWYIESIEKELDKWIEQKQNA